MDLAYIFPVLSFYLILECMNIYVYVSFLFFFISWFICFYFIIFLAACWFSKDRERRCEDLCGWGRGEDFGWIWGEETLINIHRIKYIAIFSIPKTRRKKHLPTLILTYWVITLLSSHGRLDWPVWLTSVIELSAGENLLTWHLKLCH